MSKWSMQNRLVDPDTRLRFEDDGESEFAGSMVNDAPARPAPFAVFLTTTRPQLEMSTATGGMKSFRAAVKESDERLLR